MSEEDDGIVEQGSGSASKKVTSKGIDFGGWPVTGGLDHFAEFFRFDHLPPHLREISAQFAGLARWLARNPSLGGPELTVAMRKLLEAKDAAVRARIQTGGFSWVDFPREGLCVGARVEAMLENEDGEHVRTEGWVVGSEVSDQWWVSFDGSPSADVMWGGHLKQLTPYGAPKSTKIKIDDEEFTVSAGPHFAIDLLRLTGDRTRRLSAYTGDVDPEQRSRTFEPGEVVPIPAYVEFYTVHTGPCTN